MTPLRVACIVKNSPASFGREDKNAGYFSYAVPEFEWEYFAPGKGTRISTEAYRNAGFDLIFHIDGGAWAEYVGAALPVVYYAIDSTLSEQHYIDRLQQAQRADLVLIDHDRLERFAACKRVRRWSYCVNDKLFYPRTKDIDVFFHCGGARDGGDRARMRVELADLCAARKWVYVSGTVDLPTYAARMGRAKVVVNVARTETNRPHRVFDAAASGAALVTTRLPEVEGEDTPSHFPIRLRIDHDLDMMLDAGGWQVQAAQAQAKMAAHTWATRAQELRTMLRDEFGL